MINKTEEWLYKKAKEVDNELELQDLYTSKFSFGGRWVMDLLEEYHKEQLTSTDVVKSFCECKGSGGIRMDGTCSRCTKPLKTVN